MLRWGPEFEGRASRPQRTAQPVTDGPGAQSYSTANVNSMAGNVNKSFNKSAQSGTGGFGTSARRTSEIGIAARGADVPGPGEYAPDISDAAPQSARPSSAFASRTNKGDYVRKTDAAGVGDYDAHTSDGMAATATKTFNRKSLGSMGSSKRFMPAKEAVQGDYSGARPGAFEKSMTKSGRSNTGFGKMAKSWEAAVVGHLASLPRR